MVRRMYKRTDRHGSCFTHLCGARSGLPPLLYCIQLLTCCC